ncbi:FecR family protein [Pedobacter psychrodurus]|uniref:FecR family protein n=1 Tax=Pedobacter psychrodurus TaxID=2530456 RepID=UPI00292DA3CC|nr:FecR domain-containing protein [Pedobacter psychrodurus]
MEFNSSDDFIEDESFVDYCLNINETHTTFWKDYAIKNPEKIQYMEEAAERIENLQLLLLAEKLKPQAVSSLKKYLNKKRSRTYLWRYALPAAAALLVFTAVTFVIYRLQNRVEDTGLARFSAHKYFYQAGPTQRKAINLWDGSFVILEKNAALYIDSTFGQTDRSMHLSGVAYFKVAKDKTHPFKVYTNDYVTTAVGTAFKLAANNSLKKLKVELEEGKVTIAKRKGKLWNLIATLNPKESVSFGDRLKLLQTERFSLRNFNNWKAQEIIFKDAPLNEVLLQLEIYYNVAIDVEDSDVGKETFNGTFRHDSIKSVMEMLCFSVNKHYKFTDPNHIVIY